MHDRTELEGGKIPDFRFQYFTFHSDWKCTCMNLYENTCVRICMADWNVGEACE